MCGGSDTSSCAVCVRLIGLREENPALLGGAVTHNPREARRPADGGGKMIENAGRSRKMTRSAGSSEKMTGNAGSSGKMTRNAGKSGRKETETGKWKNYT